MSTSTQQATTSRLLLLDAIKQVRTFANTNRAAMPALSGIRLDRTDGQLELTVTDLDTTARAVIPSAGPDFAALVPGKMLEDSIKGLDDDDVELRVVDDRFEIVFGDLTSSIRVLPLADFPGAAKAGDTVPLLARDLDVLGTVARFASTDEARPVLCGVRIEKNWAVTTDSYRLGCGSFSANIEALFSAQVAAKVAKWDNAEIGADDNWVWFRGLSVAGPKSKRREIQVEVVTNIIDGAFPSWQKLIPDTQAALSSFVPDDVAQARKIVAGVAKHTARNTPVVLTSTRAGMEVALESRELARVHGVIPGRCDGDTRIALNPQYLLASIDALADDEIRIKFYGEMKPCMFHGAAVDVLLMPMRIN